MRKWIVLPFILMGLIALQACAPKAQNDCGFQQNVYGERISWKGRVPVTFFVHSSVPSNYLGAIEQAAQTWNDRAGKTVIEISHQPHTGGADGRDRANVISFAETWDKQKQSEQAKTIVHWIGDQIQEADIKVNASRSENGDTTHLYYWNETVSEPSVNLEALVLHEMGHALGLKHNDKGSSVMATYLANNSDRTELSSKDTMNLQCEY